MNRTKIETTDYTWNPVTGCRRGCSYCYARRIAHRFPRAFGGDFEPRFWEERLLEPAGLPTVSYSGRNPPVRSALTL